MKRRTVRRSLEAAVFGVNWDLGICQQSLGRMSSYKAGSVERTVNFLRAIDALGSAKDCLVLAERYARELQKGGAA